MRTRQTRSRSGGWEGVRRRFERWRAVHPPRTRLPETLWAAAVTLAKTQGVHRTAKALRLDYYSLKKRVPQPTGDAGGVPVSQTAPTFLEFLPQASAGSCECLLELEDGSGARMRVQLKGIGSPDLAALGRSFWNPAS